ncbi:SDR family NAD(P)-dependent oxidoreductase [Qipengyuania sediminis]|uniref:SDR family NAD(P)-dependent oxidoreductase n=1 Tax=Qipengyuania sediminis TaxID=1532023 RepID=UPI0010599C34|nr:SDR family NAD(P)-dependent oxidoreductase [Qipengyuania sediminis]
MHDSDPSQPPRHGAVFGASGGIGGALVAELAGLGWRVAAGSRGGRRVEGAASCFAFDLADEASIAAAAARLDPTTSLVVVATGALVLPGERGPERSLRQLDAEALADAFRLNTIGPAMIAKHVLPRLPRARRSVFAALGARVGSIGDNRLGGWHGYRASKAALAMLIRNFAIEMARTHPQAIIVGLHPGTVATPLSAPFVKPGAAVFSPADAARQLVEVLSALTPAQSGRVIDWAGKSVPE